MPIKVTGTESAVAVPASIFIQPVSCKALKT